MRLVTDDCPLKSVRNNVKLDLLTDGTVIVCFSYSQITGYRQQLAK